MFETTTSFNSQGVVSRYAKLGVKAQVALGVQVLKDSNYFVPEREGDLKKSGVVSTDGGEVRWEKNYARRQYNEFEKKGHDKNPNARWKWFEWAKNLKLKVWIAITKKAFGA
jgi:hypothetical protein